MKVDLLLIILLLRVLPVVRVGALSLSKSCSMAMLSEMLSSHMAPTLVRVLNARCVAHVV
eukprot:3671250-Amphidinium_carterae.1